MKFKKLVAVTLAATMVFGSSLTVFADTDSGSATQDGAGTSEGHVNKEIMDFVLPTTTNTTFAYTMDPERLITATDGAKYGDSTTFPDAEDDTGVYFLTATNTYANTSNTVQAINKGSIDATLSVKVKTTASTGDKDIALATAALSESETTAKLYLAANIGGKSQILSATEAEIKVVVPGNANNYETVYADSEYKFQKKTSGLTAWKAVNVNLTGAVTKGIAVTSDTTAPKVTFTFAFNKKGEGDASTDGASVVDYTETPANAAPSIATKSYTVTSTSALSVTVNLGAGDSKATGVSSVTNKGTGKALTPDSAYTFSGTSLTFPVSHLEKWVTTGGDARTYVVKFNDTAETEVEITLTPATE